jgi:hypothetical protein
VFSAQQSWLKTDLCLAQLREVKTFFLPLQAQVAPWFAASNSNCTFKPRRHLRQNSQNSQNSQNCQTTTKTDNDI